jgi:hypothetical protein
MRARRRPGGVLLLTVGLVALFATGIGPRPAGATGDRTYDVVLYNLPYLAWSACSRRGGASTRRAARACTAGGLGLAVLGGHRRWGAAVSGGLLAAREQDHAATTTG